MAGYNIDQKPGETLQQYYRRLAKTADQRLVRLESYEHDKYFKPATQWAYSKAQKDIQKWLAQDHYKIVEVNVPGQGTVLKKQLDIPANKMLRFNTKPPKGEEQLLAKINDIKSFLQSPTSTKQGIINVYKKRADTLNRKYGTQFTWQSLAKYYESGQAEAWDAKFGSKTALKTIAQLQKQDNKVKEAIKKAEAKDIRVDNSVLQKTVDMALADNNLNIKDLL